MTGQCDMSRDVAIMCPVTSAKMTSLNFCIVDGTLCVVYGMIIFDHHWYW